MLEQYLVLSWFFIVTRITWAFGQLIDLDQFISYMDEDPEAFRLWDHLLLYFHKRPFSIITLLTMSFIFCMMVSYIIIMPAGVGGLVFAVGFMACAANFSVRHSIQYPLLALLGITGNPVLLVPLILTKEISAWVGLGYLLLTNGLQPLTLFFAALSFLVYVIMKLKIGKRGRSSYRVPLFAVPCYVRRLLSKEKLGVVFWNIAGTAALVLFLAVYTPLLLLWTALPVFLFALFWEPQLWFPTVIVILAGGV